MKTFIKVLLSIAYSLTVGYVFTSDTVVFALDGMQRGVLGLAVLFAGPYLIANAESVLGTLAATYQEMKVEFRGYKFVVTTQPAWFICLATIYLLFWRIPVMLTLGTLALLVALVAIALHAVHSLLAPQLQAGWVPDSDAYVKAVKAYYVRCEAEYKIEREKTEKGMRTERNYG